MRRLSVIGILLVAPHALFAVCRSEVTNAPLLRLEGQAELLGTLQFACNSNSAAPFDITVTLSVPVATPLTGAALQILSPNATYSPVLDAPNRVRFSGITLPVGLSVSLSITGLRGDVSGVSYARAAAPPVVHATVASPTYPIALQQRPVGYPTPSYSVALRTANGTPATNLNLAASTTDRSHELIFRESFPSAFQTRFRDPGATQGTRLVAQFTNLPPGASLAVSPLSGPSTARLITDESGPYAPAPSVLYVTLPITNGAAKAVWEVLTDDPTRLESYSIGLIASGPAVSSSVTGRLGPADQTSLPRYLASAPLPPADCAVPCVVVPKALHFTWEYGQPPPPGFQIPYFSDIGTVNIGVRIFLDSPYSWLTWDGTGPTLQFGQQALPPGRYTAHVDTIPGRSVTWVVLNVLPPFPGVSSPLLCTPGGGVPSFVRAEGLAEPIANFPISCTGGVPGTFVTATIAGSLNTFFASRILDNATSRSETLLTVGDPAAPTPGVDEFYATRTDSFGRFEFRNVTFQVPPSRTVTLWISNLRVEGRYIANLTDSFSTLPVELILTASGNLAIPANKFPIGVVQRGFEFDLRNAAGEFVNSISQPGSYVLRFTEGSPSAFRRRNVATSVDNPSSLADQSPVSNQFFTETMNYAASRGIAGLATQGTRLHAAIKELPSSSRVFATVQPLSSSSGAAQARLISSQAGPFSAAPISNAAPPYLGAALPMAEITRQPSYHNLTWEVLGSSPFQTEQFEFGIIVTAASPTGGEVAASLAPEHSPPPTIYPRFQPVLAGRPLVPPCPSVDCIVVDGPISILQDPAHLFRRGTHDLLLRTKGGTFRYFATSDAPWLQIPEPVGVAPSFTFSFVTDPAGLSPGIYRATLRINETSIPVTFTIPGTPPLTVSGSTISARAPDQRTLQVSTFIRAGSPQLDVINILVNNALDGRNACYLAYSIPAGALFLVNDAGPENGLSMPLVLGSNGEIANSQCRIRGATSSARLSANNLDLLIDVTFNSIWTGSREVFVAARAAANTSTGWVRTGPVHLPESPTYPRALPIVLRSNSFQTLQHVLVFEDATNANNLETVWGLINSAVDARGACYFAYYVPGNLLFLYPDNGNGAEAKSILLAGDRSLSNSQCTISASGAEVQKSGKQLILKLPILNPQVSPVPSGIWGAAKSFTNPQASPWRILDLFSND